MGTSTNDLELIPDKPSLWTESMLWDKDLSLRAGIGYKDNVLLSPSSPHGSAFFTSGLDLLVFRLPLNGLGFNLAVTGDDVRYQHVVSGVEGEDAFLANAQVQKCFDEQWRSGLEVKYLYLDQVAQELIQTGGVSAVVAKGNTLGMKPFVRRDLGSNWWAQLEFPVAREWWQSPLDDDWKLGPQIVLGRSYGFGSQVTLTYGALYIPHDDWLARDAEGTEIPGQTLTLWRQVAELKGEHYWDAARRWRSTTKLGFQYNQDNGGGFFNYYLYSFAEELRFSTRDWELRASTGVSYYDFPIQPTVIPPPVQDFPPQPVTPTPPSPTLYLTTVDVALRAERRIYRSLRLFAAYEYERVLSNQAESQYTENVVSGGLSWEF